jgi:hypothetical protein
MKIATIINYCTNDYVFLKHCIDAARPFSSEIIVPYCDHFFDGTSENQTLLKQSVKENPGVQFVEYEYDPTQTSRWHCNMSRKIGIELTQSNPDYFLFLDTDEIVDYDKFFAWIKLQEERKEFNESYRLANYFYFRQTCYQCTVWEDSVALVKNCSLVKNDDVIFSNEERHMFYFMANTKERMCTLNNEPFVHHYSWVRSKDTMTRKVLTWSHNKDRDWLSLVNKEFEMPFRGTDMIFNKNYVTVTPYIDFKIE